jgi:hypothetical protein
MASNSGNPPGPFHAISGVMAAEVLVSIMGRHR